MTNLKYYFNEVKDDLESILNTEGAVSDEALPTYEEGLEKLKQIEKTIDVSFLDRFWDVVIIRDNIKELKTDDQDKWTLEDLQLLIDELAFLDDMERDEEALYNELIDEELFKEEELGLLTCVAGLNMEVLNSALYCRYGLRSYYQLYSEEDRA